VFSFAMGRLRTKHTGFYHVLDDKLRRAYYYDDGDFAATIQNRKPNTDENMLGVSVCT